MPVELIVVVAVCVDDCVCVLLKLSVELPVPVSVELFVGVSVPLIVGDADGVSAVVLSIDAPPVAVGVPDNVAVPLSDPVPVLENEAPSVADPVGETVGRSVPDGVLLPEIVPVADEEAVFEVLGINVGVLLAVTLTV